MATLFDMYKDVATPDVFNQTRAARQESESNTKKTMDTSFGMLKKSNIGTLQQEYRAGTGRFEGITDPDKKFQVYYDALKALDPQAAQDAAKVYGEERQRRINSEIASAYIGEGGDPEVEALTKAIKELESSIASEEASAKATELAKEQEQVALQQENEQLENTVTERFATKTTPEQARDIVRTGGGSGLNPALDTGRINNPADLSLTPDEGKPAYELEQDWSNLGYVPLPRGDREAVKMSGYTPSLRNYYSTDKKMPTNDISLSTVGESVNENDMEGYVPANSYDKFKPRTLSSMYRGF